MPSVETILSTWFSTRGQAWDRTPSRKATMLFLLPALALLIAVSGMFLTFDDLASDYPSGYVVSSSEDCRLGTCRGLDTGMKDYYDPGRGIQTLGDDDIKAGFVVFPVTASLGGVPALLAWIHTLQKRRARTRAAVAGS